MKGDFTRSTFQPKKHYTSVRMQQGRLQLDSDWNEQADIQNYLRRAQVTDMIGSGSGAAKVNPIDGSPSEASFKLCKIVTTSSDQQAPPLASDIAVLPGHFYVNGVLCELAPGSHFRVNVGAAANAAAGNTLEVLGSLTIDGRRLQAGDWLTTADAFDVFAPDAEGPPSEAIELVGWRVEAIDPKTRKITVQGDLGQLTSDGETLALQRVITYSSQPDFPNPPLAAGPHFVYLDVWERHITALDDPTIREVALNVPDTTTRTQTVWQLKLLSAVGEAKLDKTLPGTFEDLPQSWREFEMKERSRTPLLNTRVCPGLDGRHSPDATGNQRLENHLYRIEIHHGNHSPNNQEAQHTVSFKWSRDNGSVASTIIGIDGDTIRIRKSSQTAWEDSIPGQWLEILTAEQELKGDPGVLVPLRRVSDTKIEFDPAGMVDGPIPPGASKVRRWDHTQRTFRQGVIPVQSGWVEIENGLQVKFGTHEASDRSTLQEKTYRTGDYWLIPSRAASNSIEWPTDQADEDVTLVEGQNVSISQPLPQPAQGIEHNYGLMALADLDSTNVVQSVYDKRILFPPLLRALDRAGGIISGDLEIRGQLSVTRSNQESDTVDFIVLDDGNVGIGTDTPDHALEVHGKIQTTDLAVTGQFSAETLQGEALVIAENPTSDTPVPYGLLQAIPAESGGLRQIQFSVSPENSNAPSSATAFTFLNGRVGIGKSDPESTLDVEGTIRGTTVSMNGETVALNRDLSLHINNTDNPHTVTAAQIDGDTGAIVSQINANDAVIDAKNIDTAIARQTQVNAVSDHLASVATRLGDHLGNTDNPHTVTAAQIDGGTGAMVNQINAGPGRIADKNIDDTKIARIDRVNTIVGDALTAHTAATNPHGITAALIDGNAGAIVNQINAGGGIINAARINPAIARVDDVNTAITTAITGHTNSDNPHGITASSIDALSLNGGGTVEGSVTLRDPANPRTSPPNLPAASLVVDGEVHAFDVSSSSFNQLSSRTIKDDIDDLTSQQVADALKHIRPVTFRYKDDQRNRLNAGFIAEETPDLLTSPSHDSVKLMDLIAVLTKAVQDNRKAISTLNKKIKKQDQEIAKLHQMIAQGNQS